jgi:proline dehydrogenase
MPSFLVRFFARSYVSGDSIAKGVDCAEALWNENGISSTMDLLGEAVTTREDVEQIVATYLELINFVSGKEYITISVKPTAFGIHESYEYCRANLQKILVAAENNSVLVTLDMEDHNYTDVTLELYQDLLLEHPNFGTVLQSRLFRTSNDIKKLPKSRTRIRLCIGIYNEDAIIALTNKDEMKKQMIEMAQNLINSGSFVEFATHDEPTLRTMIEIAKNNCWTKEHIEFQMLMGVPMLKLQKELLSSGYVVRLYVPFAMDWKFATPYLKRRLANNPKMAIYVLKHMFGKV